MFPFYIPSALEDSQTQLKAGKATLQDSTHQTPERLCQRHSFVCDSAAVEFLRMILEQTGHRAPCVSGTSTHQHHVSSAHKSKFTQVAPRNVLQLCTPIVVEMSLFRKSVCVCVWSLTHSVICSGSPIKRRLRGYDSCHRYEQVSLETLLCFHTDNKYPVQV